MVHTTPDFHKFSFGSHGCCHCPLSKHLLSVALKVWHSSQQLCASILIFTANSCSLKWTMFITDDHPTGECYGVLQEGLDIG